MTDDYEPEKPNGMWQKWTVIGTDGDGSEHVVDFVSRTVYVVAADGDLEYTEYLAAKQASVEAWMKHVDDVRGWSERNYGRSLGTMLGDTPHSAEDVLDYFGDRRAAYALRVTDSARIDDPADLSELRRYDLEPGQNFRYVPDVDMPDSEVGP